MDLAANDLGEQYIDNETWSYIENPDAGIEAVATGACDVKLFVKLNAPACVKTVDFKFTNENGTFPVIAILDFELSELGKCNYWNSKCVLTRSALRQVTVIFISRLLFGYVW